MIIMIIIILLNLKKQSNIPTVNVPHDFLYSLKRNKFRNRRLNLKTEVRKERNHLS